MNTDSKRSTRSSGPILSPDQVFPPLETFHPPTQLPTYGSIISMTRFILEVKDLGRATEREGIREVAKVVYAKYYHDTV